MKVIRLFHLTRFQLGLIFIALLFLRVVVGFHFYKEGTTKLKSGFTAKYFFAEAKGPLTPVFKRMLDDPDGKIKLCLKSAEDLTQPASESSPPQIDPEFSFLIWDDFIDQATKYYGFGSPDLIARLKQRLAVNQKRLLQIDPNSQAAELAACQNELADDEQFVEAIAQQPARAEEIFQDHKELLAEFLDENRTALISYFGAANRLTGFDKDGASRKLVAADVESLRYQVDTIDKERRQQLQAWSTQVVSIWDSLEQQINALAVDAQAKLPGITLHRPFDQKTSWLKVIDQGIPWFDTVIGVLLILGLFTRLASGAAAAFLLSVIATQPPWVPGTQPTYFYFIEMAACLVIFATAAGRFGGLDFFFSRQSKTLESPRVR